MISDRGSITLSPSSPAGLDQMQTPGTTLASETRSLVVRVMCFELCSVVFTQMMAIPLGSADSSQVAVALPIHFIALSYLIYRRAAIVDPTRLLLYVGMAATAIIFHIRLSDGSYSPTSLALFICIYSTYIFVIPIERADYIRVVKFFILIATVASCLVWLDWLTQIVGLGKIDLYHVLPRPFQYRDYNYLKRFWFGPIRIQPNGIIFLESSHVSQFIAMALVCEIVLFMRIKRMLFLGLSLLGTIGGSGLGVALLTFPFLLPKLRGPLLLGVIVGAPVAIVLALQIGLVDNIARRTTEFDKADGSANLRFIAPMQAVAQAATGPVDDFLLGKGAGTMPRGKSFLKAFTWAPYSKVIVEYGAICAVFWFFLTCFGTFRRGVPFAISWSLFIQYHLMNGSLNVPLHTIYIFVLSGAYIISERSEGSEKRRVPVRYDRENSFRLTGKQFD